MLKENYDESFLKEVYQTPVVTFEELRRGIVTTKGPVRIQYNNRNQYKSAAKSLGIMDDFKVRVISQLPIDFVTNWIQLQSGVPRTAYNGVVSSFYNNQRVYLAPSTNWKGYDPSWS